MFNFRRKLFSKVVVPFYIPTSQCIRKLTGEGSGFILAPRSRSVNVRVGLGEQEGDLNAVIASGLVLKLSPLQFRPTLLCSAFGSWC